MKKLKFDLEYFRKFIPADELESNHRACLFADDCRMIKNFRGDPTHFHFWSRKRRSCFTVSFTNKIVRISNN